MTVKSEIIRPVARSTPGIAPSSTARWYLSPAVALSATAIGMSANKAYYQPMLYTGMPIDRIGFEITSGITGEARLAIYTNNNGAPDTLIVDAGTVDLASATTVEATISTLYLPVAWVWVAAVFSAGATTRICAASNSCELIGTTGFGAVTRGLTADFTYGEWTAAAPVTNLAPIANVVALGVRKT